MWQDIAEFGKKLVDNGLVESQFGNISIRNGDKILITKSGVHLDKINKDSVVEVEIDKPSGLDSIASSELAEYTAQALSAHKGAVVFRHGTFAIGKTLEEAYFVTALMEQSCKMKYYLDLAKR